MKSLIFTIVIALMLPLSIVARQSEPLPKLSEVKASQTDNQGVDKNIKVVIIDPPKATSFPIAPTKSQMRAHRHIYYGRMIDSLIESRNYTLQAVAMNEIPEGKRHNIETDFYALNFEVDSVDIYLPAQNRLARQTSVVNTEPQSITHYNAHKGDMGWEINCKFKDRQDQPCTANVDLSEITGEAIVKLVMPDCKMRYECRMVEP